MAKTKILTMIPNSSDPLSFYRAMGPFNRMYKDHPDEFEFFDESRFNWANMGQFDVLFCQRPYKPEHLTVVKIAKQIKMPIVMDYDDWLFDLKTDNPAWKNYIRNDAVRNTVEEIYKYADVMMVTTEHLKSLYEQKGVKNVVVVPNAYDASLFTGKPSDERKKILLWRGSDTHVHDCITVLKGYEDLIKKYTDWKFVFIHQYPWFFSQHYPNMEYLDGLMVIDYLNEIRKLTPAIFVHPLSDCDFNRAKSAACYVEAAHSGATFVGPNFDEFNKPGCVQYEAENPDDFFNKIDELIRNPIHIAKNAVAAWEHINTLLELGTVNKIRYEVFKSFQTKQG